MPFPTFLPTLPPRRLLLLDGAGAMLSALLLGVVLVRFEPLFGLPARPLYCLSLAALLLSAYSFAGALRRPRNWRRYLQALAALNLTYCGVTTGLLGYWHEQVTTLGLLYFVGELMIIGLLAATEWKTAQATGI